MQISKNISKYQIRKKRLVKASNHCDKTEHHIEIINASVLEKEKTQIRSTTQIDKANKFSHYNWFINDQQFLR